MFHWEKRNIIKNRVLVGVKSLFGFEENYYKPIKTNEALDDYFLEIQSSGDKDYSLTLAQNLDEF